MQLVDHRIARAYCRDQEGRAGELDRAERQEPPAYILPLFELCRLVHHGAIERNIDPVEFRKCLSSLALESQRRATEGFLFHVIEDVSDGWDYRPGAYRADDYEAEELDPVESPDPRRSHAGQRTLVARLRALHLQRLEELATQRQRLRWSAAGELPEDVPRPASRASLVTVPGDAIELDEVVLDTMVLLAILEARGRGTLGWQTLRGLLSSAIVAPIQRAFESHGERCRLLIPLHVLVEAQRRARHVEANAAAREPIQQIVDDLGGGWHHVFDYQPLTWRVFGALLELCERLLQAEVPSNHWPQLSDALVLAHGIDNGCPVLSTEWIHPKASGIIEWQRAGDLFPFLRLA